MKNKRWKYLFILMPFIIGSVSYYVAGEDLKQYLSCVKSNIFNKGSIAVYCDADIDYTFETGEKKPAVIYPGREYKNYVDTHIIMLDSDAENFKFYEKYKQQMKGTVYICIRETEYALIQKNKEIRYFDIYGSIARQLWKENIRLWERQGDFSCHGINFLL